ncbi:MAG: hypothetical protein RSD30_17740 [Flavobacterium sp.]
MNDINEHIDEPQSDVYVELSAVEGNQKQKGIIFSKVNSLKQDCEVLYEPHESILDAGIYSFDLFYEPNITVDDADLNQKSNDNKSSNTIVLKLKKPKE